MENLKGIMEMKEVFDKTYTALKELSIWARWINKKYDFTNAALEYKEQLDKRYDTMKIIGMTEPTKLRSIYVRVNILEKITSQQRASIEDLEKFFDHDKRGFGVKRETKDGIEVVKQLPRFVVLGKPGAGKSTFLKYIALRVADGTLNIKRVPIFISLKDLSDKKKPIFDYIAEQFDICKFSQANPFIERMLELGNCILLFDGLDEVSADGQATIIGEIKDFSDKYNKNQFVLSCRIAAYNASFPHFTDVELADFDDWQIQEFIKSWFGTNHQKTERCWKELQTNFTIKELAAVPLLLTLLCLAFDETMSFPKNRAELYQEAIDALLKKWDKSRNIERGEIYKNLSLIRKQTMLSRIAATTFEVSEYFMPQRALENYIAKFIQNLPDTKKENLEVDSEIILKGIEAQHGIFVERARGIYSFSHLTFQEYFTAKYIVDNAKKGSLNSLVENHFTDDRWREVFLLTAGMMPEADDLLLLIKEKIDSMLHKDITKFLEIVLNNDAMDKAVRESIFLAGTIKEIDIGTLNSFKIWITFYAIYFFENAADRTLDSVFKSALDQALSRVLDRSLDLARVHAFDCALNLSLALDFSRIFSRDGRLVKDLIDALTKDNIRERARILALELVRVLDGGIPNPSRTMSLELDLARTLDLISDLGNSLGRDRIRALVRAIARPLARELDLNGALKLASNLDTVLPLDPTRARSATLVHTLTLAREITYTHAQAFDTYLKANLLLIQCLQTECYISNETRETIINSFLSVPPKH